jgi:hypothetical protein
VPKQAGRIACGNLKPDRNFASPLTKRILAQEVEVNTAQVKGNWQQLVGKAKKKWGRLTEEPLSFTDLGEQQVKNITQPIRV